MKSMIIFDANPINNKMSIDWSIVTPLAFVSKAQGNVTFIIIVAIVKPSLFSKTCTCFKINAIIITKTKPAALIIISAILIPPEFYYSKKKHRLGCLFFN